MFGLSKFKKKENTSSVSSELKKEDVRLEHFSQLLDKDDFISLQMFKRTNQEALENDESFKKEVFDKILDFFRFSLKNPEDEDFDNLHKLVDLNILPIEYFRNSQKMIMILETSLTKLSQERNMNGVSRIKNLLILPDTYSNSGSNNVSRAA